MTLPKRTPCVGICSTTYGDLVCRGCKRFAHEVVQWNGYDGDQQERVWMRLQQLRDAVVTQYLRINDKDLFERRCVEAGIDGADQASAIYKVIGRLIGEMQSLDAAGLEPVDGAGATALAVMQAIDAEMYTRSVAHYERNFKIPL